jgi:hypothetical protein
VREYPLGKLGDGVVWVGPQQYRPEDRQVNRAAPGSGTTQRDMVLSPTQPNGDRSMVNADTHRYINYTLIDGQQRDPERYRNTIPTSTDTHAGVRALVNRTGTVDMPGYMGWLRQHGYVFYGDAPRP